MSFLRVVGGATLVALGAALLLDAIGVVALSEVAAGWWPVILVAAGVALVVQASTRSRGPHATQDVDPPEGGLAAATATSEGTTPARAAGGARPAATAVLGRRQVTQDAGPYRGGAVTVLLGGLDLDLTRTTLPPEGAVLDVTAILGDVSVRVPEDWRVRREAAVLAADVEQRPMAGGTARGGPELVLCGTAVLADVDVRSDRRD